MGKRQSPGKSGRAKKKHVSAAAVLAVCAAVLVLLIGAAIGRYQTQIKSEASVRAMEFYFTSDLLDGGTHTLAPGSTEVSFTLGNHADELRYSEMEIDYTVTVVPDAGVTVEKVTGTLAPNAKSDATVTLKGLKSGGTYTVEAVGTGGYEKKLTATIVIPAQGAEIYQHLENYADTILLTVWNEGETSGTVTITYDGIPDNTNPNMTDWVTGGTPQSVTIEAHASKVFRFFNATTVNVTGAGDKIPD